MTVFELSERTKRNISNCVGVPFEQIIGLTPEEEVQAASRKRGGGEIVFSRKRRRGRMGRGSPLLARKKIRLISEVDKKIARVK